MREKRQMSSCKPILIIDHNEESRIALELFNRKNVEYVQYHIINSGAVVAVEQVITVEVHI